ncbi:MAG: peptidoglycan-binding protein [Parcubacteria group bacterium]|nr:peptidoglycan-binding protein [Parcubacteria group bacterium]
MSRKIASVTLALSTTLWLSSAALIPVASAITVEEIQAQITALQAQLTALLAGSGAAASCSFSRSLYVGVSGDDVMCLQKYLNGAGYQIASSGAGSPGSETQYFGSLTKAAVAKWQAANSVSPAVGYFGVISRAKYDSLFGVVPPVPGVSPVPVVSGALNVSLEPSVGGTVVADTTSGDGAQALAEVLKLRFSGSGKVTQLKLHRIGVSADSDFSNGYLYDGDVRLAEAPAVSSNYFTFTNSAGLFSIAGSKVISFKIDVANGISSGKTFQFGVLATSDIVSDAATLGGAVPFHGPEWRTATVGDLGKLTATTSAPSADATVDAGSTDYEVWKFTLQANDQNISVPYLKFTMVGTADYDAVQNLKLYVDGVQVGSAVPLMNSDKSVAYSFASPVAITSGVTKTLSLRGDVVKGSNRNFYFQIQNASDIVAKDMGYGVLIKVNQADVWNIVKPPSDVEITINAGSLSIQKSANSPTGPLADGATNLELGRFDFKAVGEDIKLSTVTVRFASTSIKNLKLTVDGVQIGTTIATAASATNHAFNPGGSFVVQAGKTKVLVVSGDLTHDDTAANSLIQAILMAGSANALRQSSGSTFNAPSSNTNANSITVTSGSLSVVKNVSVANIATVKGASGIVIGSWLITAPTDQGVNVTSFAINNGTGSPGLGSGFDTMSLWSGGVQLGQTVNSPSSATGTAQTFSLGTSLNVPAGQAKQIDLKANVITNADAAWAGGSDDLVKVTTVNTTGVVTNSAVNKTTDTLGQTLNILSAATLTIKNEAAPTAPSSQYLVAGDTGATLHAWKFSVDNSEDVNVNRVEVRESHSDDTPGNLRNIKLFVDGVQIGATVPAFTDGTASANTALFEDTANGLFSIVKNTSKTLVVKADITPNTDATFSADANGIFMRINIATGTTATATTNVSGKGKTSGAFVTLLNACSDEATCDGNSMKVVKTKPTFSLVAPSSTTLYPTADAEIMRFRITAHAAEDVKFVSGTHNIRLTQASSPSDRTAYNFKLYDNSTVTQLASVTTATATDGTTDFTGGWSDIVISKGTSREFYVLANLSNFPTTGHSFKVTVNNAAADFSWSDNGNASADIEEANFAGIGLPLYGPSLVKP